MLTRDVVRMVANKERISIPEVQRVLNAVIEAIELGVSAGDSVQVWGFGRFEPREVAARTHPVPAAGGSTETRLVEIDASRTIAFLPTKALKQRLNR